MNCKACESEEYANFVNRVYKSKGFKVTLGEERPKHTCAYFFKNKFEFGLHYNNQYFKINGDLLDNNHAIIDGKKVELLLHVKFEEPESPQLIQLITLLNYKFITFANF